jgi:hypothetical protein
MKRRTIILVFCCLALFIGGGIYLACCAVTHTTFGLIIFPGGASSATLVANLDSSDRDLVMTSLHLLSDRGDPAGQAKARQLLSGDSYIWLNATLYLGELNDPTIVPHLIRALKHNASRAHPQMVASLQRITGQNFGTDQVKWIDWWRTQNPGASFEFTIKENMETAQRLSSGVNIVINSVIGPTTISHVGAPIELIGVRLKPGANAQAATAALSNAVIGQFVELQCDDDPQVTPDGARRALAYWVPDRINDPTMQNMIRRGLGPVPFSQRTLIQKYLLQTGYYEPDPDAVHDPAVRAMLTSASGTGGTP